MRCASVLLLASLCLASDLNAAEAPTISRTTEGVGPDEPIIVAGTALGDPRLRLMAWCPEGESGRPMNGQVGLPTEPPKDARSCPIRCRSAGGLVATAPSGGPMVLWAGAAGAWSNPYVVNRAIPYFCSPEPAAPGDVVSLYGRNLTADINHPDRAVHLVLRDPKTGQDRTLAPGAAYGHQEAPLYEVQFEVPAGLADGDYAVHLHSGGGGPLGWAAPFRLDVRGRVKRAKVLRSADIGARGDGVTDDTPALQKAIDAMRGSGGELVLGPGRFILTKPLILPPGVTVRGCGMDTSVLAGATDGTFRSVFPAQFYFGKDLEQGQGWRQGDYRNGLAVHMNSRTGLYDLTVAAGPQNGLAVLVDDNTRWDTTVEDVHIERCRIVLAQTPFVPYGTPRVSASACIRVDTRSVRMRIERCRLEGGANGVDSTAGLVRSRVVGNVIRPFPLHAGDGLSGWGWQENLIAENIMDLGARGVAFQQLHYRNVFIKNEVRENGRAGNASETYLWEGGEGRPVFAVTAAAQQSVTLDVKEIPPYDTDMVTVVDGRGVGQVRLVKGRDGSKAIVDRPWLVTPDSTSRIALGGGLDENLILLNTDRNGGAAVQLWGYCFGNVVDHHVSENCQGYVLWASHTGDRFGGSYFNEFRGCRAVGRGSVLLSAHQQRQTPLPTRGLLFGNLVYKCDLVDSKAAPTHHYWPYWEAPWYGFDADGFAALSCATSLAPETGPRPATPAGQMNVFYGNHVLRAPNALRVDAGYTNTFFLRTTIQQTPTKALDKGQGTVIE